MAKLTTIGVKPGVLAKLRVMAGSLPLGQYMEKLVDGVEIEIKTTFPADAAQWSRADLKVLVTAKLDQLEAKLVTLMGRAFKDIRQLNGVILKNQAMIIEGLESLEKAAVSIGERVVEHDKMITYNSVAIGMVLDTIEAQAPGCKAAIIKAARQKAEELQNEGR